MANLSPDWKWWAAAQASVASSSGVRQEKRSIWSPSESGDEDGQRSPGSHLHVHTHTESDQVYYQQRKPKGRSDWTHPEPLQPQWREQTDSSWENLWLCSCSWNSSCPSCCWLSSPSLDAAASSSLLSRAKVVCPRPRSGKDWYLLGVSRS